MIGDFPRINVLRWKHMQIAIVLCQNFQNIVYIFAVKKICNRKAASLSLHWQTRPDDSSSTFVVHLSHLWRGTTRDAFKIVALRKEAREFSTKVTGRQVHGGRFQTEKGKRRERKKMTGLLDQKPKKKLSGL